MRVLFTFLQFCAVVSFLTSTAHADPAAAVKQQLQFDLKLALRLCYYEKDGTMKYCTSTRTIIEENLTAEYEKGDCISNGHDCSDEFPYWVANFENDFDLADKASGTAQKVHVLVSAVQFGKTSEPYLFDVSLRPKDAPYWQTQESSTTVSNLSSILELEGNGVSVLKSNPDGTSVYVGSLAQIKNVRLANEN